MSKKNISNILHTKFGTAKIHNTGYYIITSGKEMNHGKYLHRLIYEDYYDSKIPEGYVIHHKDENKLNNNIFNLELISESEHHSLHKTGENHPNYGKKNPEHAKRMKRNKNAFNSCLTISKIKNKTCKQGYVWVAQPSNHEKKHYLSSVDLDKCIEKVINFINSDENTYGYDCYQVIE